MSLSISHTTRDNDEASHINTIYDLEGAELCSICWVIVRWWCPRARMVPKSETRPWVQRLQMDVTKAGHCCHATIKKSNKKSCTPRKTRLESSMGGYSYLKSNTWNTLVCDVKSCNLSANFTLRRRSFLGQMSWATQPRFRYTPYRSQRLYYSASRWRWLLQHQKNCHLSSALCSRDAKTAHAFRARELGLTIKWLAALWFVLWLLIIRQW